MKNTYLDLIDQSYYFPQEGFDLRDGYLTFHNVSIQALIKKYGTPFKLFYLPKISQQIQKAKSLFQKAINELQYQGDYHYYYSTKSAHYAPIIEKSIENGAHLETSSEMDLEIIWNLFQSGKLSKKAKIIHNGYKPDEYIERILDLHEEGFQNLVIVFDSISEIVRLKEHLSRIKGKIKVGVRIAIQEEPNAGYHTSRHGILSASIPDTVRKHILVEPKFEFVMFHFFVDSGMKDTMYYWGAFQEALELFISLKKECQSLHVVNLGGGFPVRNRLNFEYQYEEMIQEIVRKIQAKCIDAQVDEPDIATEFGKFTVGESGATIFSIIEQKQRSEDETWYLIDSSIISTLPDAWIDYEKFILLPINKWNHEYVRVKIGGISCDHTDFYHAEHPNNPSILPRFLDSEPTPLYIGFFHTGAYQDAISGYGGVKHCLIPEPVTIFIDLKDDGTIIEEILDHSTSPQKMLEILGYQ